MVGTGPSGQNAGGQNAGNDCNTFPNTATTIEEMAIAEDLPDAVGGTIVEGTYELSAFESYVGSGGTAGPLGTTRQQTITIAAAGSNTYDIEMCLRPR